MQLNKIKRALISVTDKSGIVEFARNLKNFNVEILSTGGTAAKLKESGIDIVEVSDYTGFPEMMDGRLKTLHPKIHGGILAVRDNEDHRQAATSNQIQMIDMVVINLYQFEKTVSKPNCSLEEAIENIDIGGPTIIRAAAKNFKFVSVVTDLSDYAKILNEMMKTDGCISQTTNFMLAKKAFQLTAQYDAAISNYLGTITKDGEIKRFPDSLSVQFIKALDLRYGENPHQSAAFYREPYSAVSAIDKAYQLQGKELSYNNIMDSDAAWQIVREFNKPAAIIVKHTNPCGVAISESDLCSAYQKALETDPVSAFGGIVALNRPVDEMTAVELSKSFLEVIIAPSFNEDAKTILSSKKNVRLLEVPFSEDARPAGFDLRKVIGGLLVQERNFKEFDIRKARVVTKRTPSEYELRALEFAWKVVKHVKSNAIVITTDNQTVGIGAGQMSRIDSVKIAIMKAILPTTGCVLASDAFFPFRDGIDMAAEAGITAVIQPGGSIRDEDAISAANEHGITMLFTETRHFKH